MTVIIDGELGMWTVYERPSDYPEGYVARLFKLDQPQDRAMYAPTLTEIREKIDAAHPGLFCMPRQPGDESQIVEVWF